MFSSRFIWNTEVNHLTQLLEQKRIDGYQILDLTASNPTSANLIYNDLEILAAISLPLSLKYEPDPKGLLSARTAVVEYYQSHHRFIDPDSIFLTASTSEAYSFVFKLLCDPGQEILVPQPGYPLLDFLAGLEQLHPVCYDSEYDDQTNGWKIRMERLESLITPSTAAIVIVNPNNPTGAYLKTQELAALNRICMERDLALIVDEVFLDYSSKHDDRRYGSTAGNSEALTFVLSGLSKIAGLPQLKLGWIVLSGPDHTCAIAKERLEWIADTYLSVSTAVQHGTHRLLQQRNSILHQIRNRIFDNERLLKHTISKLSHSRMLHREGGWYAIIEIQDGISDDDRCLQLLKHDNVLIHPGYFYGFHRNGFIVVSLLTQTEIFKEGISKILRNR